MWGAKALTRLRICTDSPELLLLAHAIRNSLTIACHVLMFHAEEHRLGEAYALDQFALFFIDVRILKRIPNYVITSMRRFRVGDIRTPWKITKYRVSISNTGSPETSQIYQVSIRWWPASMVNGVARTLKKLRTSNGDYCNKQWFSTIQEQFLGYGKSFLPH